MFSTNKCPETGGTGSPKNITKINKKVMKVYNNFLML